MKGAVENVRNEIQIMLTQIVRELLNNVIQHSRVNEVKMVVICENKFLNITISDTGRGFNPQDIFNNVSDRPNLSLLSIRERLKLFNGDLTITSRIGQGTICTVTLPLENC